MNIYIRQPSRRLLIHYHRSKLRTGLFIRRSYFLNNANIKHENTTPEITINATTTDLKPSSVPDLTLLNQKELRRVFRVIPSSNLNDNVQQFALLGEAYLYQQFVKVLYEIGSNLDEPTINKTLLNINDMYLNKWTLDSGVLEKFREVVRIVDNYLYEENVLDDHKLGFQAHLGVVYLLQKQGKDVGISDFLKPVIINELSRVQEEQKCGIKDQEIEFDLILKSTNHKEKPDDQSITNAKEPSSGELDYKAPSVIQAYWKYKLGWAKKDSNTNSAEVKLSILMNFAKDSIAYRIKNDDAVDGITVECLFDGDVISVGVDTNNDETMARQLAAQNAIASNQETLHKIWLKAIEKGLGSTKPKKRLISSLKNVASSIKKNAIQVIEPSNTKIDGMLDQTPKLQPKSHISIDKSLSENTNHEEKTDNQPVPNVMDTNSEELDYRAPSVMKAHWNYKLGMVKSGLNTNSAELKLSRLMDFSRDSITYNIKNDDKINTIIVECRFDGDVIGIGSDANNDDIRARQLAAQNSIVLNHGKLHEIWLKAFEKELESSKPNKRLIKNLKNMALHQGRMTKSDTKSFEAGMSGPLDPSSKPGTKSDLLIDKSLSENTYHEEKTDNQPISNVMDTNSEELDYKVPSVIKQYWNYRLGMVKSGLNKNNSEVKLSRLMDVSEDSITYNIKNDDERKNGIKAECLFNGEVIGIGVDAYNDENIAKALAAQNAIMFNNEKLYGFWFKALKKELEKPQPNERLISNLKKNALYIKKCAKRDMGSSEHETYADSENESRRYSRFSNDYIDRSGIMYHDSPSSEPWWAKY